VIELDALEPIALDDLVATASLQTRVDRKYAVPQEVAELALAEIAEREETQVLTIGEERCFGYESLYFDTPELTSYHLTACGRRRRFKVRRRTYLDGGVSYLEVKTCGARGVTVKDRVLLEGELRGDGALPDAAGQFVETVLDRAGIRDVRSDRLRPALWTRYRRATLLLPAFDSRVTVDTALAWTLPDGECLALPDLVIVETKSPGAACAVDRRLWAYGHRPRRVSKYGTGLATLRAELPSNRWHALIRKHFAGVPVAAAAPV
jgi:hypothetical protein